MRRTVDRGRVWTAAPLGAVFALSFCPVSAALFFGSLVPLAVDQRSPWLLPTLYGVGTGLPVAMFALLLAVGAGWLGAALDRVQSLERVVRPATGVVFIAVGIWETLRGVFHVVG
jgi:threonine/homoserine/homoserine lactone efflux protein